MEDRLRAAKPLGETVVAEPFSFERNNSHANQQEEAKMKKRNKLLLSLFCYFIVFSLAIPVSLSAQASPATIYVPDDYPTIQAAVDAANSGDIIVARDGTYIENVWVNKSLTIQSENGAEETTVQAANPANHVFQVYQVDYVSISGFTVQGEIGYLGDGIYLQDCEEVRVTDCLVKSCNYGIHTGRTVKAWIRNNTAQGNKFNGIDFWECTEVLAKSNHSSSNGYAGFQITRTSGEIVQNHATENKWGISLHEASDVSILENDCTSNVYGIQLYQSSNNRISNNVVQMNSLLGIYMNALSNGNIVFLNNFLNNRYNARSVDSTNTWNCPEQVTYTYDGRTYTNYMGNYLNDYTGSDTDGNGIGDTPYIIDSERDNYPLMQPFQNYQIGVLSYIGRYLATAYAYPEEADNRFGSFNSSRTNIKIMKKDSTIINVSVKRLFYRAMKMNGGGLVNANPQNYTHIVRWTLVGNIFEEIDEVLGSQGRPLVSYQSVAKCPGDKKMSYGDRGYFTITGTNTRYEFSVDDTCPACCKRGNGIDVWLGVGKEAYFQAQRWGVRSIDVYVYK